MSKFSIAQKNEGGTVTISIGGSIDEDSRFETVSGTGVGSIVLDLKEISSINSCGIREWVKWVKTLPTNLPVVYTNVPKVIVEQMNMITGFFNPGSEIRSFVVPYYCEECDVVTSVLYSKDKDFNGTQVTVQKNVACKKCQKPTEIDVLEAKYFKFLKG